MHQAHIPGIGQLFFSENYTPQNCDALLEITCLNCSYLNIHEKIVREPSFSGEAALQYFNQWPMKKLNVTPLAIPLPSH
jgi:hypothetical protein